jgi:CubicO group peptidase (beta-lactamase class C family)
VSPTQEDGLTAQVDAYLAPLVADGKFSGSVLLARDGEVLARKAYGLANRELDVPTTPQTKFRIGSLTKQFTAMAILLLQQQGKLSVSDHICQFISDCPDAWQEITIHHLLTHSSGIPNVTDLPVYRQLKLTPSRSFLTMEHVRDLPLAFTPGSRFSYTNSGYIILGYIIEQAAQAEYPVFVRGQIFEPLQMQDTGYDTRVVPKQRAAGYTNDGTFNADFIDMSVPHAAGGLYSTVDDLYRWDQALYTEQLIPKAALETMFTPHVTYPPPEEGGYGYGWGIS